MDPASVAPAAQSLGGTLDFVTEPTDNKHMTTTTTPKATFNGGWQCPLERCDYAGCSRYPEYVVSNYGHGYQDPSTLATTERRPMCRRHAGYHMTNELADVFTISGKLVWRAGEREAMLKRAAACARSAILGLCAER